MNQHSEPQAHHRAKLIRQIQSTRHRLEQIQRACQIRGLDDLATEARHERSRLDALEAEARTAPLTLEAAFLVNSDRAHSRT